MLTNEIPEPTLKNVCLYNDHHQQKRDQRRNEEGEPLPYSSRGREMDMFHRTSFDEVLN